MVSLLHLPTETIVQIADNFQWRGVYPVWRPWPNSANFAGPRYRLLDLMNLCSTCSMLRNIVQPIIFKSLHVHFRSTGTEGTFKGLVQTLSLHPSLGKNTRNLLLTSEESTHNDGPDEENVWRAELPKLVVPMLELLPNVTSLHFWASEFVPNQDSSNLGKLLSRHASTTGGPVLLPHLRALYISVSDGAEDCLVRIADFTPFFSHPGLKKVTIYAGALLDSLENWSPRQSYQLLPGSLDVSTLNLFGCLLEPKSAQMLLESCKKLKSLSYSQMDNNVHHIDIALDLAEEVDDYVEHPFSEESALNLETLSAILENIKTTLETLQINFTRFDTRYSSVRFKFSGFQTFSRLASLDIEARHFESFTNLPPTLKHLTIRDGVHSGCLPSDVAIFLRDVGDAHKTKWPSLKSVLFDGHVDKDSLEKDIIFYQASASGSWMRHGRLKSLCCLIWNSGGVEFTLRDRFGHRKVSGQWTIAESEDSL